MQAVVGRQKECHGPRCSMRRPWKLGKECDIARSLVTECGVLQRIVLARIATLIYTIK